MAAPKRLVFTISDQPGERVSEGEQIEEGVLGVAVRAIAGLNLEFGARAAVAKAGDIDEVPC